MSGNNKKEMLKIRKKGICVESSRRFGNKRTGVNWREREQEDKGSKMILTKYKNEKEEKEKEGRRI